MKLRACYVFSYLEASQTYYGILIIQLKITYNKTGYFIVSLSLVLLWKETHFFSINVIKQEKKTHFTDLLLQF
jgi:hypothetical protein